MDERDKAAEQVEDLEVEKSDAEEVKGGLNFTRQKAGGVTAEDDWEAPVAARKNAGGGWDANHNETLITF